MKVKHFIVLLAVVVSVAAVLVFILRKPPPIAASRFTEPDPLFRAVEANVRSHAEMASAPTLGLDAFCQKLVIWQDEGGTVHVTFNDLLALANRQNVSGGLPLRVINRRL